LSCQFFRAAPGLAFTRRLLVRDQKIPQPVRRQLWEGTMTAFNIVRFRVKPGREAHFIAAHRNARPAFKGFRSASLVKTGERTFCIVGEWASFKKMAEARPQMIAILDTFRDDLEDLGGGLGLTDPVSGELVLKLAVKKPAKKAKRKKRR
jgi:hypothetical protein